MPRRFLGRALESKVARRMSVLFVLCTILPLAAFAWFTVRQTSATLEERAWRTLQAEARGVGQEALGRLDGFSRALAMLAAGLERIPVEEVAPLDALAFLRPRPRALSYVAGPASTAIHLAGAQTLTPLTAAQERQLDIWGQVMVGTPAEPVLIVSSEPGARQGYVAAAVNAADFFSIDDEDALPPDSTACVLSNGIVVACSPSADPRVAEEVGRSPGRAEQTLEGANGTVLARAWQAPLIAQYGGPTWTTVLMRPRSSVLAPVHAFTQNFLLLATGLALIVTWVSLAQVRRQLLPLDQLTAATRRMASRNFDDLVRVTSGDEFEALADAFNDLSRTLKSQFSELEAFNLGSLAALARAIDAKSPWTSGHSERVTAIAVALGRELGLTGDELQHLRRGGLVHDLGKVATPQEILDKPGRLTDAEHEIMERHPMQGVRILEPIPAFAPLLPIVAEHHEWWNGGGYPKGLTGTAISRTARVLAVADVYDALRSDRPYRAGLPHTQVVDVIVSRAGQQFDPEVVDAFLSVAARIDALPGYPHVAQAEPHPEGLVPELVQVGRD